MTRSDALFAYLPTHLQDSFSESVHHLQDSLAERVHHLTESVHSLQVCCCFHPPDVQTLSGLLPQHSSSMRFYHSLQLHPVLADPQLH
jgi:hypothetical protein